PGRAPVEGARRGGGSVRLCDHDGLRRGMPVRRGRAPRRLGTARPEGPAARRVQPRPRRDRGARENVDRGGPRRAGLTAESECARPRHRGERRMNPDWIDIAAYDTLVEAELAGGRLESADIPFMIDQHDAVGL